MAQTMVNFRMDEDLKKKMEKVCADMGMSMTTAFTIFAKTVTREKKIPFEVTADPFYSENNLSHLRRGIKALNDGCSVAYIRMSSSTIRDFPLAVGKTAKKLFIPFSLFKFHIRILLVVHIFINLSI